MNYATRSAVPMDEHEFGQFRIMCTMTIAMILICVNLSSAQLTLSGGNLTLMQEGPAAAMAGDPAPANLATGAVAFTSSDLGSQIGVAFHVAANLNDSAYGNGFSWIGGDTNPFPQPFAGIDLGGSPVNNVQSIALGRSNVLAGDACGGGLVCTDRHLGLYRLQYTQVPNPSTNLGMATTGDALTGWVEIGTLDYGTSEGGGTNYNNTWQRHRYNFDPVNATGVRLIVPATGIGSGTAIDEIELYDVAGDYVPPPPPPAPITFAPAAGFSIGWDGNDGDYSGPAPAVVPNNDALASNGATAFTSSDLGPQLGIPFHVAGNLNDGLYGNANSWIGGDANPFPAPFAGVELGSMQPVTRVAWGRDNTGEFKDRWVGAYTLQYTQVADVDQNTAVTDDPTSGWASIGTIELKAVSTDDGPGGKFTGYLRHAFDISQAGQPVLATGVRLVVPATGLGAGTDIDELEVYVVPEPSSVMLLLAASVVMFGWRRRSC